MHTFWNILTSLILPHVINISLYPKLEMKKCGLKDVFSVCIWAPSELSEEEKNKLQISFSTKAMLIYFYFPNGKNIPPNYSKQKVAISYGIIHGWCLTSIRHFWSSTVYVVNCFFELAQVPKSPLRNPWEQRAERTTSALGIWAKNFPNIFSWCLKLAV